MQNADARTDIYNIFELILNIGVLNIYLCDKN